MRNFLFFILAGGLCLAAGCGGGASTSKIGANSIATGTASTNNVQAVIVDAGPTGSYVNGLFTTVTVCAPASATCQNIDHVLVDTGSEGLRIMASVLTIPVCSVTTTSNCVPHSTINNSLIPGVVTPGVGAECVAFQDGSMTWGALARADVKMGGTANTGEVAFDATIQLIGDNATSSTTGPPSDCMAHGTVDDTVATLGANGIIGVGSFLQDCGAQCTTAVGLSGLASGLGVQYYSCPATGACANIEVATAQQVVNPVSLFSVDNSGVIIELPAISANGAATVNGSMVFGIATQSNNAIAAPVFPSTAAIYSLGFTTRFNGTPYLNGNFIDSGSNGLFFLDAAGNPDSTGMPLCSAGATSFYCPGGTGNSTGSSSVQSFNVQNQTASGAFVNVGSFSVANANTLLSSANTSAFNDLGKPLTGLFDFGLPFFFGRNVGVVFTGENIPGNPPGPYYIY